MQSPGRRESGWRVGQGTPTSGRHSGPQGRGRFIAVRLDGPQARSPQRCDGVCHSNLRMTPNAGIPAEKGPPRNWGPSRRPPSAGCADRRSAFPCGRHFRRSACAPLMPGGVCRRTRSWGFLPVGAPPSRALSAGRLPGLGAHAGSTTGCSAVIRAGFRSTVAPCTDTRGMPRRALRAGTPPPAGPGRESRGWRRRSRRS